MAAATTTHKLFTSLLLAAAVFYLCFHTLHGEQGLYALLLESHRQEKLEMELSVLKKQRLFLEHKVALMRGPEIDADLLDEETRRFLGFAEKNELVVFAAP